MHLTQAQRHHLDEQGYLVVDNVFDPVRDFAPIFTEYNQVLDGIARELMNEGLLRSTYHEYSFCDRLLAICGESRRAFPQHFDISLPQTGVCIDTPLHVGPAVFGLLTHPRLLDLVEEVIGSEVYSNPVQHIRIKLPPRVLAENYEHGLVTKIPWHQDNGVLLPEADEATILTVWLPLTEATVANGCLQVVPGSHRWGLTTHCPAGGTVAIPQRTIADAEVVPLPMKPGSVLLMHQRTVHSSLDNTTTDGVRVSFDLRYQPVGQPTGRPHFPGFVARSRRDPTQVLRDAATWAQLWYDARVHLAQAEAQRFNRWNGSEAVCA